MPAKSWSGALVVSDNGFGGAGQLPLACDTGNRLTPDISLEHESLVRFVFVLNISCPPCVSFLYWTLRKVPPTPTPLERLPSSCCLPEGGGFMSLCS